MRYLLRSTDSTTGRPRDLQSDTETSAFALKWQKPLLQVESNRSS